MTEPAVRAQDLTFDHPGRRALDGVSFAVPTGSVFGFLGPNGSGKTTLFQLLATLLPLQSGAASVAGHDLAADPRAVRRALGVAFQAPSLDLHLTCAENLRHHGHLYGLRGRELERRVGAQLDRFSLADRRDERAGTLSGGLRRRVELAKALLPAPPVLLLDEPSTGLDPRVRRELMDVLTGLASDGGGEGDRAGAATTVLLTTHFIEEAERCHRLLLLDRGRIVAAGEPDALTGALGGEVVTLECEAPAELAAPLERALADLGTGARPEAVDGALRFELPTSGAGAWETVGRLARTLDAWDERVKAVTVARPDLEDVFLHHTGRRLDEPATGATGRREAA